jgi:hypothetical protein
MFDTILKRLDKLGTLNDIVLVGSWAAFLYKYYFPKSVYSFIPRTTDIDLLIPTPYKNKNKIDLPEEFKDLNFIVQFSGQKGYIRLGHPELSIDFLVPEMGKGSDEPYIINNLHINAQPIRYVNLLLQNVISVDYNGIAVKVPHPSVFALQKLLILRKRQDEYKKLKDIETAKIVFNAIMSQDKDKSILKSEFDPLPNAWKKDIIKQLHLNLLDNIANFLRNPPQQAE